MDLDLLNDGTSLKRRKSESEDSVQDVASENVTKKQKQENIDTSTTDSHAENEIIQENGNSRETKTVAIEDGSERINTTEFGNSMRDNCFLAATESVENANADEPENGTETELTEENKNTEEIKNGTETDSIEENKKTEEVENDAKTEIITENEFTEEDENGTETENIVANENTEEFQNDVQTEPIAEIKNIDVENDAKTAIIEENEYMEEAENGTETENIAENKNAEEVENGPETDLIAENNNADEIEAENDAQIDNCAQKEGSQIANSTEEFCKVQVPRGIDKWTSVKEDDLIERERELDDNVSSRSCRSHEYYHHTTDTWHSVDIQRFAEAEPVDSSSERAIYVYNTNHYVDEDVIKIRFRNILHCKELFYHGTTRDSAKSIIEKGIQLKETHRELDFSQRKGFYVTDNYDKACEWSKRKARMNRRNRSDPRSTGAVIAFTIDTEMRRNERHLSLMVDSDTNRKFWECIVGHFRRGQTSEDVKRVLRDVKYIEGPVAMIRRRGLASTEIPIPYDNGQFRQLCICDHGYAKRLGSLTNILCVIFLKD